MKYMVYQIDSFTKKKFCGNPAGVVLNANGLSEVQMQSIARELNNSETAFVFNNYDESCDCAVRYFTPKTEVPVCGHATIAAIYAKAIEENLANTTVKIKTNVGILPIEILEDRDNLKIQMTQGAIAIDEPLPKEMQTRILSALGISEDERDKRCPIEIASTGHSKVMIAINSKEKLDLLTPNFYQLTMLSKEINCNGYFVFTLNSNEPEIFCYGRMFAPAVGINEDPVTGNANGPLGAYLIHNSVVQQNEGVFSFRSIQGEAINRPGIVEVSVSISNGRPQLVKIAGNAVSVFKTTIEA